MQAQPRAVPAADSTVVIPPIISVDDHVLEPQDLWQRYLPARWRDEAPKVVRLRGHSPYPPPAGQPRQFTEAPDGTWADLWSYDGRLTPITRGTAAVGGDRFAEENAILTYDDIRPGCFDQQARLEDMSLNGVAASLCFPSFPRFCGQTFLERGDRELSLLCVRAYNDWMINEWCGGAGRGVLLPLTLIPLWDVGLAVAEVRRCAEQGSHAIAFSESPSRLSLPSLYSGYWDPLWQACLETDTVVNTHIGSSSHIRTTAPDAPGAARLALTHDGATVAFIDWLLSGVLERFPIRVVLSEGQVGWMPFIIERLDKVWLYRRHWAGIDHLKNPPSASIAGHLFGCVFDDAHGLRARDQIGIDQIMFESDYPHGDSTWPDSVKFATELVTEASLSQEEIYKLIRGNAIRCFRLDRHGVTE